MSASGKLIYGTSGRLVYGRSGNLLYADRYLSEAIPGGGSILGTYCRLCIRTGNGSGASYSAAWTAARSSFNANDWSFTDLATATEGYVRCDPSSSLAYPTYSAALALYGFCVPAAKWDRGSIDRLYGYVAQMNYGALQDGYEVVLGQVEDLADLPDSIAELEAWGDRVVVLDSSDLFGTLDEAVTAYVVSEAWVVVLMRSAASTPISGFTGAVGGEGRVNFTGAAAMTVAWPLKA